MDQINVIPFIDIMLVLLVIVLTTATFIVEGRLQIALPEANGQSGAPAERLEIAVDGAGGLYLGSEPLGGGASGLAALGPRLDALGSDTAIVLRVDAGARFESFVAVVDLLKTRGLERLTILTRQP
jgi:biopolymer transport protein ExbD